MTATPTPGDLSARHVEVLRAIQKFFTFPDDAECKALDAAIAALSALPAGGECQKCGDTGITQNDDGRNVFCLCPTGVRTASIPTTPPPADAAVGQGEPFNGGPGSGGVSAGEPTGPVAGTAATSTDAAVGAQGDVWQDKVLKILRPLLDTGDSRTADDKAVAIYAILADAAPAATPTDGGEGNDA